MSDHFRFYPSEEDEETLWAIRKEFGGDNQTAVAKLCADWRAAKVLAAGPPVDPVEVPHVVTRRVETVLHPDGSRTRQVLFDRAKGIGTEHQDELP
jgi:hypothetical protein